MSCSLYSYGNKSWGAVKATDL